jgi:hypothetical protein
MATLKFRRSVNYIGNAIEYFVGFIGGFGGVSCVSEVKRPDNI